MRILITCALLSLLISCSNEKKPNIPEGLVGDVILDITAIERFDSDAPILEFKEQAKLSADKVVSFTKENINEVFEMGINYSHCIITTGDHTIISIADFDECNSSPAWMACMPMAKGYIKRIDLKYQEDYASNIIGNPDIQERLAFFFN
ncbi:MAG: hypothetical protein NWR30_02020 [Salibacteraceae bacterium]|jgi:hypothetical protein|nr:hypothetical protein [Salibacteraceae bacterium]MDP4933464.1 hypothetical protein [Salibacteraceae bacterium]